MRLAIALAIALAATTLCPAQKSDTVTLTEAKRLLRAEQQAAVAVAKQATPGVVYIEVEREVSSPFWDMFDSPRMSVTSGSGVVVRSDGTIVTNNHIVAGAQTCKVRLAGGLLSTGRVLGTDPASDIAVVKVDASNLPVIAWGDSDKIQVGEWVMAIGNPYGLEKTVTTGIVSAKGRQGIGLLPMEDFIQTDAAINPGNSGGALVNIDGELIGVNSMIYTQSGGSQGIGFAIPAKMVKQISDEIVKHGNLERGWIGFVPARASDSAVVYALYRNGPAHRAGLDRGDRILAYNGKSVASAIELRKLVMADKPGNSVSLKVEKRGGDTETVSLRLGKLPLNRDGTAMEGI